MSQVSEIVLGFPHSTVDPARAVGAIFKLVGATKASGAHRSIGESRDFDRFLAYCRDEIDDPDDDPDVEYVRDGGRLGPRRLAASVLGGTCLWFSLTDEATLLDVFTRRIEERIDESVRGGCFMNGFSARVGDHDVFTRDDDGYPILQGRYPISITFTTHGMPYDIKAFMAGLSEIDEFADFVSRAEVIFGKSETRVVLYY